jgi:hypothetical protein
MTASYPKSGDLVIADVFRNVSGNSSIPFQEPVGAYLGTLDKIDDATYVIRDEDGQIIGSIGGVYNVVNDSWRYPKTFISGWLPGHVWGQWVVTC